MARENELRMQDPRLGDFTLRRSRRAKRVLFKIAQNGELTVVLPWHLGVVKLPEYLDRKREWIEATRERLQRRQADQGESGGALPSLVQLRAVNQVWKVDYAPGAGCSVRLCESPGRLALTGAVADEATVAKALRAWAAHRGKVELLPWALRLAREHRQHPLRISIRGQKTRWGSCSSRGGLNLNWKLLFLQPELCRYVLLHELAHMVHLNHSPAFWKLLEDWEPKARELDHGLRDAWSMIPQWAN